MKLPVLLTIITGLAVTLFVQYASTAEQFLIDDFETRTNAFFSKTGVYKSSESDAKKGITSDNAYSGNKGLFVGYKKEAKGFCGYYLEFVANGKFFNASKYSKLTFMIKGKRGGENFKVGLADKAYYEIKDSIKSNDIGTYLPDGKVTTDWQKAEIPLQAYVDRRAAFNLSELGSVAFCFESTCFPDGVGQGIIYIDDLAFE